MAVLASALALAGCGGKEGVNIQDSQALAVGRAALAAPTTVVQSVGSTVSHQDVVAGVLQKGASIDVILDATQLQATNLAVAVRYTDQLFLGMAAVSTNSQPTVITTTTEVELDLMRVLLFKSVADYYLWYSGATRGTTPLGVPPRPIGEGGGSPPSVI